MYETTEGVRLDNPDDILDHIDVYKQGVAKVALSVGDGERNIVRVITPENAVALGFGLLRAGLDFSIKRSLRWTLDLLTGDGSRG
jgi:hypothetical protein